MEFYGRHEYSVDKNRILIPSDLRGVKQFYAIVSDPRNPDFPLLVEWLHLGTYFYALLFDEPLKIPREIQWYFDQNTRIIKPDKQNRILIPGLNLGDKAYFIGLGDKAEVWPKTEWERRVKNEIY
ncbi:MAG: hypothetical protein N3D75_03435 [Candidatus Aenigmarchaeota archaeon]|nr:hypothetical protein [Candidatus Aenigmarchaeota archaeon]